VGSEMCIRDSFLGALTGEEESGGHRLKREALRVRGAETKAENKPNLDGRGLDKRDATTRREGKVRATSPQEVFMKMPLRFISSAWGFGEKRRPSALLILPALMRR
jgi:hypothetical protein